MALGHSSAEWDNARDIRLEAGRPRLVKRRGDGVFLRLLLWPALAALLWLTSLWWWW